MVVKQANAGGRARSTETVEVVRKVRIEGKGDEAAYAIEFSGGLTDSMNLNPRDEKIDRQNAEGIVIDAVDTWFGKGDVTVRNRGIRSGSAPTAPKGRFTVRVDGDSKTLEPGDSHTFEGNWPDGGGEQVNTDEGLADDLAGSVDESIARSFDDKKGGGLWDGFAGAADNAAGSTDEAVHRTFDDKEGGGVIDGTVETAQAGADATSEATSWAVGGVIDELMKNPALLAGVIILIGVIARPYVSAATTAADAVGVGQ